MRSTYLPFAPPLIGAEEIDEVVDTLRSGWLTTGPKARKFEECFAEFFSVPAALALNSCTAGLHSALVTLGIGPGDEVITTCMTFAASVNVIEHVGAKPVLVDIEPDTLNLDPAQVERAITANSGHFARAFRRPPGRSRRDSLRLPTSTSLPLSKMQPMPWEPSIEADGSVPAKTSRHSVFTRPRI